VLDDLAFLSSVADFSCYQLKFIQRPCCFLALCWLPWYSLQFVSFQFLFAEVPMSSLIKDFQAFYPIHLAMEPQVQSNQVVIALRGFLNCLRPFELHFRCLNL